MAPTVAGRTPLFGELSQSAIENSVLLARYYIIYTGGGACRPTAVLLMEKPLASSLVHGRW